MDKRFAEAVGRVHAAPGLVDHTRAALRAARQARKRMARKVMAAAASFVLALSAGGWLWFTPVSAVSIDAAQPVELKINRFGRVVSVEGTDGLLFSGCEEAVSRLLDELPADADGELYITVTGGDETLAETVFACTAGRQGVYCDAGSSEEISAAEEAGLPLGKYRMLLALQALDPSVTAEEVAGLSMKQLREWEASLSGEADETDGQAEETDETDGQAEETGSGKGPGYRGGNGNGEGKQKGKG